VERGRARDAIAILAVALGTFLPFSRGVLAGTSLYFRDLSLQFFPVRRFVAEGLRLGQLRFWNPYVHEGVPLSLPPVGYPPDLLHALWPSDAFFSLLLLLHLPLAAVACYALARQLGTTRLAALAGGLLFGLGGFALSTVNLYVYAQALPWVALTVLALRRTATGDRRAVALAAVSGGVLLTTTAVEFALQAFVFGAVMAPLSRPTARAGVGRLLASLALALGLAAWVLAPAAELVHGTARGAGFPPEVVLAHSVHPVTLLQTLIASLFGDPSRFAERYWGARFFPRGFPYFLSLYVGATGIALAATGAAGGGPARRRLIVLLIVGVVLSLGTFAGLAPLVEALRPLRVVRFPSKAFLTVHLSVALLAACGLDALHRGVRVDQRRFAAAAVALGAGLAVVPWVVLRIPSLSRLLLAGFFPPELPWPLRVGDARYVAGDAAVGGGIAILAGLLAVVALRGHVRPAVAATGIALVLAADLLRAGSGLNPTVATEFLRPSSPVARLATRLRAEGGRTYVLDPSYTPAYYEARARRGLRHELWSFGILQDTFTPDTNLGSAVPTALSPDRTMLVPVERVLAPEEASPRAFPAVVRRLREAGVSHVVSLQPLEDPALSHGEVLRVDRMAPLVLHVYDLPGARPLVEIVSDAGVGGHVLGKVRRGDLLRLDVEAESRSRLVVRETYSEGWSAAIDGRPATIEPVERDYMGLQIPAGRHRVDLSYHPPGLLPGVVVGLLSLAVVAWLALAATPRPQ
jgi:hypothetical protein